MLHALGAHGVQVYGFRPHRPQGQPPVGGYLGLRKRAQLQWLEDSGVRIFGLGDAFGFCRELLLEGQFVWLNYDVKGEKETYFAGRRTHFRSGIASLAFETGAPVLPVACLRRGWGQVALLLEPVDPSTCSSADEVHQCVGDALGEVVARHIEQTCPRTVP